MSTKTKPPKRCLVPWYGGKHYNAKHILPHFPDRIERYYEPFVGGGSVFIRVADRVDFPVLSDVNVKLIKLYRSVKDDVEFLISVLREHEENHKRMLGRTYSNGETYFMRVRNSEPWYSVGDAAQLVYLAKTAYSSCVKVNKHGKYSCAEGKYSRNGQVKICDADRLRQWSHALRNATLVCTGFEHIEPGEGSFVYCDPPYDGAEHSYTANGFGWDDQVRLEQAARQWVGDGATVILSNADTPATRELYRDWEIHSFETTYTVCHGSIRKGELVIVGKPGRLG